MLFAVGELQHVVIKTVGVVPKGHSASAEIVHGARDINKMLEELAGDVFISRIFFRKLECDRQHVQAIQTHPTRAVRLLEVASSGKRRGAVEDCDVVETEESTLKNIRAVRILAVHPPGKIEEQFVKHFFEKSAIGEATHAPLDFVDAPSSP